MHIDMVPNRGARPAYLLRESYREGTRVRKRTLANLSALSDEQILAIRAVLRGEQLGPVAQHFEAIASRAHGHVQAVSVAMQALGFEALLGSRPSRQRDLVCAMVAARVLAPHTKLATTRWWHSTTLAEDFGVADATEDELYAAMDWLLERQALIEKKLAARHLRSGGLVLYDLSSSYFEGRCCPLARIGHNRDGKKNKLQVNYALVSAPGGCPVAVSVYEGNTADAQTLLPQVKRLREAFGIDTLVIVGDRGMISQKAIEELRGQQGVSWITALKSAQIRSLIDQGGLQLGLFDERNLLELTHPDFPGERLVACRNPQLAQRRAHRRQELLHATAGELDKVRLMVERKRLRGTNKIGVRVGRVVDKYKMAKHFELTIEAQCFAFRIRDEHLAQEAALDGIYILRTALGAKSMDAPQVVRSYKSLSDVERAFRCLKTVDLKVRPIHHRLAERVRSHIFLCMLAYYVEWHMRAAWRSLLFADEDQQAKTVRDPVAAAQRSVAAERKALRHTLPDGTTAHSFRTRLDELSSIVRNTCRAPNADTNAATFQIVTTPNPKQKRALDLLHTITV
ncbi:MAG: IS1634 family transposase [Betaproteobacteria bacterium]|nr:IS1634 family transposase [Betaproteobacteria bacterium]